MQTDPSSLLIKNARVLTLWPERPRCDAILFEGGRVSWLGSSEMAPPASRTLDLRGRVVLPGLIDAHSHLYWLAQDRLHLNLAAQDIRNISDLLETLRAEGSGKDDDEWVFAVGLNEMRLVERRLPTRDDLDRVSKRRPIVLRRACGHAAVANSAALEFAEIGDRSLDLPGGIIEREGDRPNGILREMAAERVLRAAPVPPRDLMAASLRSVAEECLACGITGVTEAAVGFTTSLSTEWSVWASLRQSGDFPLRMAFMLRPNAAEPVPPEVSRTGIDLTWQVDTLKFFADGTIGNRSAAFSAPYAGPSCACGLLMHASGDFASSVKDVVEDGWNVAVHAIGDRAIDLCAQIFEQLRKMGALTTRLRVEHLAMPSLAALRALSQSKAIIVTQPSFVRDLGDGFIGALGIDRACKLYRGRSLLDHGLTVAASSDAPAASLSPFVGISAAMTRTTRGGWTLSADECLTAHEALLMYTSGAAESAGHGDTRGLLRPGAAADAIVVDTDPLESSPAQI